MFHQITIINVPDHLSIIWTC